MHETIGQRVTHLRNERFLSTPELARRAGISKGALYEIEAGRAMPQRRVIRLLAKALGVTPHELAGISTLAQGQVNVESSLARG